MALSLLNIASVWSYLPTGDRTRFTCKFSIAILTHRRNAPSNRIRSSTVHRRNTTSNGREISNTIHPRNHTSTEEASSSTDETPPVTEDGSPSTEKTPLVTEDESTSTDRLDQRQSDIINQRLGAKAEQTVQAEQMVKRSRVDLVAGKVGDNVAVPIHQWIVDVVIHETFLELLWVATTTWATWAVLINRNT